MYLTYLPNFRAQVSFYPAKSYNFKEFASLYVQCEATAVLHYVCSYLTGTSMRTSG